MGRGYGRGWLVGDYGGQRLISHSGGTYGFVSQVALLPEADLGVVILTNGGPGAGPFTYAVQYRLFELLFDQPATIDQLISEYRDGFQAATAQLQGQVKPVEPVAVTPFLGRFANPTLGEIRLRLTSGRLILDAGEVSGELQALTDESGNLVGYVFVSPPLAGPQGSVTLRNGADGQPEVVFTVQGESTETYVFSVVT
jgi:hypothetical protein